MARGSGDGGKGRSLEWFSLLEGWDAFLFGSVFELLTELHLQMELALTTLKFDEFQ